MDQNAATPPVEVSKRTANPHEAGSDSTQAASAGAGYSYRGRRSPARGSAARGNAATHKEAVVRPPIHDGDPASWSPDQVAEYMQHDVLNF